MPVRRGGLALATVAIAGVYAVPLVAAQVSPAAPDRPAATRPADHRPAPAAAREHAPAARHAPVPDAAAFVAVRPARSPRVG